MAAMTREQLDRLVRSQGPGHCTIIMPTHRAGSDTREDPLRFKNLLEEAHDLLGETELSAAEVEARLQPARDLLHDGGFWRHQDLGLAVFMAEGTFETFNVPLPLEQLVVAGQRFYTKPLFQMMTSGEPFYILAASGNAVRLLHAADGKVQRVDMENVPQSMDDFMRVFDRESQIQMHTGTGATEHPGRRRAMFHGQGVGTDQRGEKQRLAEFCHAVAVGVQRTIRAQDAPLVLAATEPMVSILRDQLDYRGLWPEALAGNPDRKTPEELGRGTGELVSKRTTETRSRDRQQYLDFADGERTSADLAGVVRAAHSNQVDRLFVDVAAHCWGRFDAETYKAEPHDDRQPGDEELTDLAVARTWIAGGSIHAVARDEMPVDAPVAAIYRFATES